MSPRHHEPAFQLRPAAPADGPRLAALRYRFRAELAPPAEPEGAFVARAAAWFADRLALPAWRGWVVVDEAGAIVGHLLMQFIEKVPNPVVEAETIAYITNVYVCPEQRGRGLGALLLQAALAACPADMVDTVILWPSARSVTLYRRAGFEAPALLLERPLRPSDAGAEGAWRRAE